MKFSSTESITETALRKAVMPPRGGDVSRTACLDSQGLRTGVALPAQTYPDTLVLQPQASLAPKVFRASPMWS